MRAECRHFASAFARYAYNILKFSERENYAVPSTTPFSYIRTVEGTANIALSNISREYERWEY